MINKKYLKNTQEIFKHDLYFTFRRPYPFELLKLHDYTYKNFGLVSVAMAN